MTKDEIKEILKVKISSMEEGINIMEQSFKDEDLKELGFQLGRVETLFLDVVEILKKTYGYK